MNAFKNEIHEQLNVLLINGSISKQEYEFLKVDFPITPVFYCLAKVHKDPIRGRPIVSAIGSICENISSYLDHSLQPLVKSLPSFTQDTGDILRVLDNTDPANVTFMACLDIESL